jgi:hypothetical protein
MQFKSITPESLAASGSEFAHQSALFCWCALSVGKYPELELLFHIPNGGYRGKAEAGRFKAAGVKAGVWDLFLPVARGGYHGLFVEMKKLGEKIIPGSKQDKFGKGVNAQNYATCVCDSWTLAKARIENYLNLK